MGRHRVRLLLQGWHKGMTFLSTPPPTPISSPAANEEERDLDPEVSPPTVRKGVSQSPDLLPFPWTDQGMKLDLLVRTGGEGGVLAERAGKQHAL